MQVAIRPSSKLGERIISSRCDDVATGRDDPEPDERPRFAGEIVKLRHRVTRIHPGKGSLGEHLCTHDELVLARVCEQRAHERIRTPTTRGDGDTCHAGKLQIGLRSRQIRSAFEDVEQPRERTTDERFVDRSFEATRFVWTIGRGSFSRRHGFRSRWWHRLRARARTWSQEA